MDYIRKLPGFRSGSRKRMVFATVGYLLIVLTVIGLFMDTESEPVDTLAAVEPTATATPELAITAIAGWSADELLAIAADHHLDCDGPSELQLFDETYLSWSCSRSTANAPMLDIIGLDEDRILSVSLQASSNHDAAHAIAVALLSDLDAGIGTPALEWLDQVLNKRSTDRIEIDGVVFEVYLFTDQQFGLDISVSGF